MKNGTHGALPMSTDGAADILLVEDDDRDAELTAHALQSCGIPHRIEHVRDGADALDYIASTGLFVNKNTASVPRLILLDLKLNDIGGLQVLRQLKSDDRTKGIPIVILTASKLAIELAESYKLGVNSYVLKAPDAKMFAETVAQVARYWLSINVPPPL